MKHNIKKFFNLLAVSIFIILITSSCAGAYNASWQYARTIVVNHSQVSQSFTGIPIKVFINQSTNINANGTDVRITDNSTDTDVPREIVFYNTTTAVAMDYTSSKIAYSQDLTHDWLNVSTNVTVLGNTPSGCSGINALMYYPTNNTIVLNNQTSTLCTI